MHISKLFHSLVFTFGFMFVGSALTNAAPVGVNTKDAGFINKAAKNSEVEVRITNLAQQRAQNPEVKQLAEQLHEDHMAANERLHGIAQDANIKMPKPMSMKNDPAYKRLSSLQGAAFDEAFLDQIVTKHEQIVSFYEKQENGGKSAAVSDYVKETLPTLRKHLEEAKNLQQQLNKG